MGFAERIPLIQRGNIALWITPDATRAWQAKPSGRRGAPRKYSDLAIETALTLRLVLRLPLRQAEGFLRSLLDMMDLSLEAPYHTTLSRRSRKLDVKLEEHRKYKGHEPWTPPLAVGPCPTYPGPEPAPRSLESVAGRDRGAGLYPDLQNIDDQDNVGPLCLLGGQG